MPCLVPDLIVKITVFSLVVQKRKITIFQKHFPAEGFQLHEETQHLSQALLSTHLSIVMVAVLLMELFHNSHLSRKEVLALFLKPIGGLTPISTKFPKLPSGDW